MIQIAYNLGNQCRALDVDATLQITECLTAQATDHPLETGAVISDHVIIRPKTLKLEGLITSTPLPKPNEEWVRTAEGFKPHGWAQLEPFSNALISIDGEDSTPPDPFRAQGALDVLREIHAARQPVTITTGVDAQGVPSDLHENMVVESLEFPRDPTTGDAVRFSASLKEIKTVASATVPLPNSGTKQGEQSRGKQATKTASAPLRETASAGWQAIHGEAPLAPAVMH